MGWLCFNTDADSDSSEGNTSQLSLQYLYEELYPHHAPIDQPQQPPSLCQSICNFFKKCLCCGWCTGGSENEDQQPGANPNLWCLPISIWDLLWLHFFGHRADEKEDQTAERGD